MNDFRLMMISAMYENGGNTTHRFLDGHPQMFVYPFESQLGTKLAGGMLGAAFPLKYRWPVFALQADASQDYHAIIDEECKVRSITPHVSKFRHVEFDLSDAERLRSYVRLVSESGRSRANNVAAFFRATMEAWKSRAASGRESVHVGYSPIIVVDSEEILRDFPQAHILHIVRNPWSAYADTCKRPVPMPLRDYMLGWTLNQYHALYFQRKYPSQVHVVRIEDVLADPRGILGKICSHLDLESHASLEKPTWNGTVLDEVYPWGTLRQATPAANLATARSLDPRVVEEIGALTWQYLDVFGYTNFLS